MRTKSRKNRSAGEAFEKLESRQLMSAAAFPVVTQLNISSGTELNVSVTGG